MGKERKRKREEEKVEEVELEELLPSGSTFAPKRVKLEHPPTCEEDIEHDVWLIRKPKVVSTKDLEKLGLPWSVKKGFRVLDTGREDLPKFNCEFDKADVLLMHVPMGQCKTPKDAVNLKAVSELRGVVNITERLELADCAVPSDENDSRTNDAFDIQQFCDVVASESEMKIHSIRKKPKLVLDGLKERLKAFGVVEKMKKKKKKKKKHKE